MPLTPMELATVRRPATQESFFEDPTDFSDPEPYEAADEGSHESLYEPEEDFSEEVTEPASLSREIEPETAPAVVRAYEPQPEPVHLSAQDPIAPDPQTVPTAATATANAARETESEPMTVLTVDDFAALEERILRAVSLVREERQARAAAEERAAALETQLQAQNPAIERLQQEVEHLRLEREQVRQRVERLLGQLDALEL